MHGYDTIAAAIAEFDANSSARGSIIRFDTPGGVVASGLDELSTMLQARGSNAMSRHRSPPMRLILAAALLAITACTTAPAPAPPNNSPVQMNRDAAATRGPVRNLAAQPGDEIVTIRYWKIKKGAYPQFLAASQKGIWPFFEKIGARIVGMWEVIPAPDGKEASPDYDEVYLTTRYASLAHWSATRDAAAMGGDGPDYAELQKALAIRQSLTIETKVTFLKGATGPLGPVFMPGTGEKFTPIP